MIGMNRGLQSGRDYSLATCDSLRLYKEGVMLTLGLPLKYAKCLARRLIRDTDLTVSVLWVSMLQWSSNLDRYTPFGARLLLIHCSVILRVLVCQRRIWGLSPHFVGTTHPGSCGGDLKSNLGRLVGFKVSGCCLCC